MRHLIDVDWLIDAPGGRQDFALAVSATILHRHAELVEASRQLAF